MKKRRAQPGNNSIWDNLPTPMRWLLVIIGVIYFGSAIVAPFFWRWP
jgi:hypothetical protein